MKRIKDYLTITLFCAVIFGFCMVFILTPDKTHSKAERRKLAQFPEISVEEVLSSEFSGKLEEYLLDQFPLREGFRSLNALTRTKVLGQKDVNGLWLSEGSIFKHEDALKPDQVEYGISVLNRINKSYLSGMNVYYSVIPDKNYFVRGEGLHPQFDYEALLGMLEGGIENAEYIDIFPTLKLEDYYRTDSHWSQDKILPVAKELTNGMGMGEYLTKKEEYKVNEISPFYGVYWGQAALNTKPDSIFYLTSEHTENATVSGIDPEILKNDFGVEMEISSEVYALEKFNGMDSYDMFLSGAQPIITIDCENAKTDRELIIFRDSYSSSLAPLFTGAYSKITLIDLRYIPTALLGEYVEFNSGQDALFLLSAMLFNSSMLFR